MKHVKPDDVARIVFKGEKPFKPEMYAFIRGTSEFRHLVQRYNDERNRQHEDTCRYLESEFAKWKSANGNY